MLYAWPAELTPAEALATPPALPGSAPSALCQQPSSSAPILALSLAGSRAGRLGAAVFLMLAAAGPLGSGRLADGADGAAGAAGVLAGSAGRTGWPEGPASRFAGAGG